MRKLLSFMLLLALLLTACGGSGKKVTIVPQDTQNGTVNTTSPTTEPPVTTQPPETEPATAAAASGYTTSGYGGFVAMGEDALFFGEDGLYHFTGGEARLLYACTPQNGCLSSNGETVLLINGSGMVTAVDVASGEARELFAAGAYDCVVGARDGEILLGHQEDENDWWGVEVIGYDWSGNELENLGDGWNAYMEDGFLRLESYRSDVSPTRVTIYGPDQTCLMESRLCWNVYYRDGAYSFVCLNTDEMTYGESVDMVLCRLTVDGLTVICPLGTTSGDTYAYVNSGYVWSGYYDQDAGEMHYSYYDLDGIPIEEGSALYNVLRDNYIEGQDSDGNLYYVWDSQLYVQDNGGSFTWRASLDGAYHSIYGIVDGCVFYSYYDDGAPSVIQYQPLAD